MTTGHTLHRQLRAQVLGAFRVSVDGRPIDAHRWQHGSAERLAKLMLVTPTHRVRREAAAELLWPDVGPLRAAANLRRALHFLRRAMDGYEKRSLLAAGQHDVAFAPDVDVTVDLGSLQAAGQRISGAFGGGALWPDDVEEDLELVVRLGAQELLPDDLTEEWTIRLREQLLVRWERAAILVAERALGQGNPGRASEIGEKILERDPASEEAHRLVIRSLVLEGLPHAARRQMATCRRALREAFDVEPGPDTVAALDPCQAIAIGVLVAARPSGSGV
jgi:DNA-binding SARP family transcriptional activator